MILFLLLVVSGPIVFASRSTLNNQKIIPSDSPIWQHILLLAIEQGIAVPSSSGPWSVEELKREISHIDINTLSASGKLLYETTIERLNFESRHVPQHFSGNLTLRTNVEGYFHTNDVDFSSEKDWYWDNERRSHFLLLEADGWFSNNFYLYSNFGIKNNRFASDDPSNMMPVDTMIFQPKFSTNMLRKGTHDFDTPDRAFLAAGGSHYSFQFGRDLVTWGPGITGNLVIDDHVKYHDHIRFTLFSNNVKFTSLTMFMDPPGYTSRHRLPYIPEKPDDPTVRMFLAHRLEFVPLSWLRIELSENVMYQDTQFNAKYLNPLYIFHNLSNRGQFNAIADATVFASISPRFLLYASWTVDQVTAPGEGSDQPNTMAYQLGTVTVIPTKHGLLSLTSEFVYTDPYLYLRDKVDFIIMTRERDQLYGYVPHREFLGYRYGGDAIVATVALDWKGRNGLSLGGDIFYMAHGAISMDTPFIFGMMSLTHAPSTPTEHTCRLGLWSSYDIPMQAFFTEGRAWLRTDLIKVYRGNDDIAPDLQIIGGLSLAW
ncbi:MAG: hypothetical protein PHR58_05425 [Sphaerochaetaceae bacterium]|nr:hypothetical protein [Sphaerochaetaceae bacterium]MDD4763279.1 hypothetical protein [Sphaerochaetaceae bacterium]